MAESPVRELRVAVTVEDYEAAVRFYRDALGLPVIEEWADTTGSGAILDAGRATLELLSVDQTDLVDEVEVGRTGVSGPSGSPSRSRTRPRRRRSSLRPGRSSSRIRSRHRGATGMSARAPDGMQLTLFTVLDE